MNILLVETKFQHHPRTMKEGKVTSKIDSVFLTNSKKVCAMVSLHVEIAVGLSAFRTVLNELRITLSKLVYVQLEALTYGLCLHVGYCIRLRIERDYM